MSSPVANVPSPPIFYPNVKSTVISTDSPSTPSSYVSLLDSSLASDTSIISSTQSVPATTTHNWTHTFDTLRQWSTRTFKFTRQLFQERIGQSVRTQDLELEQNIEIFRDTKRHYEQLLKEARQMMIHFAGLLQTQRSLSQSFLELQRMSTTSDDLVEQFVRNGECQKILAQNGDTLLHSMNSFVGTLQTLVTKTMEDTLMTIKAYEKARIEYDAYRCDYENVLARNHTGGVKLSNSEEYTERQYHHFKERYEKLKGDVNVKLRLLDDNRIKVMQQQLILFHKSIGGYFSLTRQQLNM